MEALEIRKGVDGVVIPYVFPSLGRPLMCPKLGFMEFMSLPGSTPFFSFLSSLSVAHPTTHSFLLQALLSSAAG